MWMKKHKEGLLKFIKACVFCAGLIFLVNVLSGVLKHKSDDLRLEAFFEEDNYDVIFLGTSHVRDGVFPMDLWNEYGIVSFDYSGSRSSIGQDYWVMVNAFDYVTPKLIVIDCSTLSSDKETFGTGNLHEVLDPFPVTLNKIRAIEELAGEENRMEYLWPLSVYHGRWSELTKQDFVANYDNALLRGATYYVEVGIPNETIEVERETKLEEDTVSVQYLKRAIEECQRRNIDVLLTYLPFPASEEKWKEANRVYDIAEEYGVSYLNFLTMDIVDYDIDCLDNNSHLNPSGARKVTRYLGKYITENYNVPDRREDENYSFWNGDFLAYVDFKLDVLKEQNNLEEYLMLLSDPDLSSCIYIREGSELLQNELMLKLVSNVPVNGENPQFMKAVKEGGDYFMIVDNGWPSIWESVDGEKLDALSTTFGVVNYGTDERGERYLYIRDEEQNYMDNMENGADDSGIESEILVITVNRHTGEIADVAEFYGTQEYMKRGT